MPKIRTGREGRLRRHLRVRKTVTGTAGRPRLAVFRSSNHIYAQIINDEIGHTLVAASDLEGELRSITDKDKSGIAELVGAAVAERAKQAGIKQVVFDRGGFRYHGRVKALADAARKAGLEF